MSHGDGGGVIKGWVVLSWPTEQHAFRRELWLPTPLTLHSPHCSWCHLFRECWALAPSPPVPCVVPRMIPRLLPMASTVLQSLAPTTSLTSSHSTLGWMTACYAGHHSLSGYDKSVTEWGPLASLFSIVLSVLHMAVSFSFFWHYSAPNTHSLLSVTTSSNLVSLHPILPAMQQL